MSKKFIFLIFLLIILIITAGGYLGYRIYILDQEQRKQEKQSLPSAFIEGEQSGVYPPEPQGKYDKRSVAIIGTLKDIKKEGDIYSLYLTTFIDDLEKEFKVILGHKGTLIPEMVVYSKDTFLVNQEKIGRGAKVVEEYNAKKVEEIFKEYSNHKGKKIRIDILSNLDVYAAYKDSECDNSCKNFISEYTRHADNNRKLESPQSLLLPDVVFPVELGTPILISKQAIVI